MNEQLTRLQNNVPVVINYKFFNQSNRPIDLSVYTSAFMLVKLKGTEITETVGASIVLPNSIQSNAWVPATAGFYQVQFYAVDGSSNHLYGEVVDVRVRDNLDDRGA